MTRITNFLNFCERCQWQILAIIILLSLAISLSYSFYFHIQPIVDARAYDALGWKIAQGQGYDPAAINRPGPGYEFFLAAIYWLFSHSYPAVWIFQSLLLAATALLTFLITKLVFRESWHPIMGLGAAALVGFSPDLITMAAMLMTETLTVFLVALLAFLFFKYLENRNGYFLFVIPLALAVTALTRGHTIFLTIPVLAFFVLSKDWRRGLVFIALLILFLTPWTARNYLVYGQFKPFNGSAGLLYVGNNPEATGELKLDYPMPPGVDQEKMPQLEFDNALGRAGFQYIISHPLQFIKLTLYRASIYFSFARPTGFWFHLRGFSKAATLVSSALYSVILFMFGAVGAWLAIKNNEPAQKNRARYLLVLLLTLPVSILALAVETRYRMPAYSLLAVFAGYGILEILNNFKGKLKVFATVSGVLIANTLFDISRNFSKIVERIINL